MTTLNRTRDYTQQVIRALHDAGWHIEAHGLGNDPYSISYQLFANGHAAPTFT